MDAVQRYALAAAERAASLGVHREAAAHYDRVLNSGAARPLGEQAGLLELRSCECYLTDQSEEAIEALERALACYRLLGGRIREGGVLRRLSEILWCPGRTAESTRAARLAVEVLEPLTPGPELAAAYVRLAETIADVEGFEASLDLAQRARRLAEELGEAGTALEARRMLACAMASGGIAELARLAEEAVQDGAIEQAGETFVWLVDSELSAFCYEDAAAHLAQGLEYCNERGLELFRLYLLSFRARLCLERGKWTEAAGTADSVLRIPRTSINPRITTLVVLALVHAARRPGAPIPDRGGLGDGGADRRVEPDGCGCDGASRDRLAGWRC